MIPFIRRLHRLASFHRGTSGRVPFLSRPIPIATCCCLPMRSLWATRLVPRVMCGTGVGRRWSGWRSDQPLGCCSTAIGVAKPVVTYDDPEWRLVDDCCYGALDGSVITAKRGLRSNLARIPRLFWAIIALTRILAHRADHA